MGNALKSFTIALTITGLVIPLFSFANGGDQRIIEGKYMINLSRAPFTPRVGIKTVFLPSFFDIQKDKLIAEDLIVSVRIAKLGGTDKRTFVFERNNLTVKGGVLENLAYTFEESGLHEIFFNFSFASDPKTVYEPPDFLLDVQKPEVSEKDTVFIIVIIIIVLAMIGGMIGWLIGRKHMNNKLF